MPVSFDGLSPLKTLTRVDLVGLVDARVQVERLDHVLVAVAGDERVPPPGDGHGCLEGDRGCRRRAAGSRRGDRAIFFASVARQRRDARDRSLAASEPWTLPSSTIVQPRPRPGMKRQAAVVH